MYVHLRRSVVEPAFELPACSCVSQFKGGQTKISQLRLKLFLYNPFCLTVQITLFHAYSEDY